MNIEYLEIGGIPAKLYRAENATGTVLAVHGFAGSKESAAIEGLASIVCEKGLNVLTYDLPAHGVRTESAEQLAAERCIGEMIAVERYIEQRLGGEMYAFATSFGGMCLLHRLEQAADRFKKILLRVPAVNMARSLVTITAMTDRDFSMEKAKEQGFVIRMAKEYRIPYHFYEQLLQCHCLRESAKWNSGRIFTVYAEKDELVDVADTERFLRLNPAIRSLCIKGAGHRMQNEAHLAEALKAAADFLTESV